MSAAPAEERLQRKEFNMTATRPAFSSWDTSSATLLNGLQASELCQGVPRCTRMTHTVGYQFPSSSNKKTELRQGETSNLPPANKTPAPKSIKQKEQTTMIP
eukprot:1455958-Amphidinium_carterae.6